MDDELFLRYRFIDNHLIKIWAVFLGGIVDWERRRPFSCPQFPLGDSLPRRRRKKYEHSIGIQVKKKNKQTYKQKFTSKFHRRRAPNFTGSNCQVDQKRNIIILDHHHHHDDCDSFFFIRWIEKAKWRPTVWTRPVAATLPTRFFGFPSISFDVRMKERSF